MNKKIVIGIDPGINCGIAIWNTKRKEFDFISSCHIWVLFDRINNHYEQHGSGLLIRIENPNTWVPFKSITQNNSRLQGAGAVKQTYKHIIQYLDYHNIEYQNVRLQGSLKKLSSAKFKQITGWAEPTNEHGRDAAMLVYGY